MVTTEPQSSAEGKARADLAAAYNILDYLGLGEGICNHLSVVVPGSDDQFLLIPYGLGWGEVTDTNLIKVRVNPDGTYDVVSGTGTADKTAAWIHSRIHAADPRGYACVFHTHQPWATALSLMKDPVLPMIHQNCLRFYKDISYGYKYDGLVETLTQGDEIAAAMAGKRLFFHRNHGVILGVENVARAVDDLYYLERACEVVVKAKSMGEELNVITDQAAQAFMDDFRECGMVYSEGYFEMMKRKLCLESKDESYWLRKWTKEHPSARC